MTDHFNVDQVLKSTANQHKVAKIAAAIGTDPDHCYVPKSRFMRTRTKDSFAKTSTRNLVWRVMRPDEALPTFAEPKCGSAGCVNPAHQQSMAKYLEDNRARKAQAAAEQREREQKAELEARRQKLKDELESVDRQMEKVA